ncbi:MAG: hypothetical protein WKF75_17180 [Singulisphaera sp.]
MNLLLDGRGLAAMRRQVRRVYEDHYTGARNYELLMDIIAAPRGAVEQAADNPPDRAHPELIHA